MIYIAKRLESFSQIDSETVIAVFSSLAKAEELLPSMQCEKTGAQWEFIYASGKRCRVEIVEVELDERIW